MAHASTSDTAQILTLLIEQGLLEEKQLSEVAAARRSIPGTLEEALVLGKLVAEEDLARVHAARLDLDWMGIEIVQPTLPAGGEVGDAPADGAPVSHVPEGEEWVMEHVGDEVRPRCSLAHLLATAEPIARAVGEAVCRHHRVVPIAQAEGCIELACLDPGDFATLEEVRMRSGCIVQPVVVTVGLMASLIAEFFGVHDVVAQIGAEALGDELPAAVFDDSTPEVLVDLSQPIPVGKDSQVIRIVNAILASAVEEGASDIHIEPYEDAMRVRFRVDGRLREVSPPPRSLYIPTVSRLKILAKMDISEKRVPQDGAIALKTGASRIDIRVSTVPTVFGEKMVMRLLEKDSIPADLSALGFTAAQSAAFIEAAESPHGLMFVTGPTGSGKSTTLYTCLQLINKPGENIVTVEDPVEYKFFGLNQVHVHSKVGLTFASALRAFLRQDPDKIMVGEVRDQETAETCLRAALTGHLVLSTLHTNSALQVVNRLTDMGVEPFLLGPALRLLEAQRLARRLCSECKLPYELPEDVALRYGLRPGAVLHRAPPGGGNPPCERCKGKGTKGRVGIYEVIPITVALAELIAQRAPGRELEDQARREGVEFLADNARQRLYDGVIALADIAEYIKVENAAGEGARPPGQESAAR